ncbi:cytochrome C oxidase subunit IV family protein [Guptibacillus hwajinpoensis]|uniref:cytochrome C oxidase subunit IV family protein n=1 Tax=Guptibacillus hwajinpoensis TaxID=208199 RepID=UPI001CD63125|nr:cytochrome C oxidase subunit IV family protein [Pseudalkalibacillus hwajinpoensis]MCA0990896.1 cytochrome C oxidase subunit IV family protein [Pseudalkalibacillus hwajinpoensis]
MSKHTNKEIHKLFLSFLLMILLTALAFFLVLYQLISPPFLIVLITFFALIQIVIQLDRFMDIREKEGGYRLTSLIGGSFVALLAIVFLILL